MIIEHRVPEDTKQIGKIFYYFTSEKNMQLPLASKLAHFSQGHTTKNNSGCNMSGVNEYNFEYVDVSFFTNQREYNFDLRAVP